MKNIALEIEMQYDKFFNDLDSDKNLKFFLEFKKIDFNWGGKGIKFTQPKFKKKINMEVVDKKIKNNKNKLF